MISRGEQPGRRTPPACLIRRGDKAVRVGRRLVHCAGRNFDSPLPDDVLKVFEGR